MDAFASLSRRKQGFESPRERQYNRALMNLELEQRPSIVHPVFNLSASGREAADAPLPPGVARWRALPQPAVALVDRPCGRHALDRERTTAAQEDLGIGATHLEAPRGSAPAATAGHWRGCGQPQSEPGSSSRPQSTAPRASSASTQARSAPARGSAPGNPRIGIRVDARWLRISPLDAAVAIAASAQIGGDALEVDATELWRDCRGKFPSPVGAGRRSRYLLGAQLGLGEEGLSHALNACAVPPQPAANRPNELAVAGQPTSAGAVPCGDQPPADRRRGNGKRNKAGRRRYCRRRR
jgi:hypothetical protein